MNKEIVSIFLKNFKKYCKIFIIAIFPTKTIATFFGLGYLPDWQDHWSTFFSIIFISLVVHFCTGVDNDIIQITGSLIIASFVLCILSFISIFLFKAENKDAKYEITIHLVFGQILTLALSMPGIISFYHQVVAFDTALCKDFIYCSPWFLNIIKYVPTALFPYFIFQLADFLDPWPSYILDKNYNNALSNTLLGFFNAIYATLFIYLLSFIFFNLDLISVIEFYTLLFRLIEVKLNIIM